jgi:hypothetical protein
MASLSQINILFKADLKSFSSEMQNANRKLSKIGGQMQKIGAGLSVGVTLPLLGLGAQAISAAADMETLKTSLDTVFQGNKAASGSAFEQIKEFAATTPFQMEEVASAFIKLKNLGLDPSIASLTSYGNTASALGKSLDQMIEAVADASVGEFERLKEFGIKAKSQGDNVSFTFQGVTTTIKKKAADISTYLQGIGNTNFAGSIERQAQTFSGKMSTLRDNMQQAFAGIGDIIIQYITPLFEKLNGVLTKFQALSPETKKWIVILGGVAAAIGPLLALAGFILPSLLTGFALLTGPIGLVIAGVVAIGVAVYKYWTPIKKALIDIANYFVELYNESLPVRIVVEAITMAFKSMFSYASFAFTTLGNIVDLFVKNTLTGFKAFGKVLKGVLTFDYTLIKEGIADSFSGAKSNLGDFVASTKEEFKNLKTDLSSNFNEALDNVVKRKKIAFIKDNIDASVITETVSKAVADGLTGGASGAPSFENMNSIIKAAIAFDTPEPLDTEKLLNTGDLRSTLAQGAAGGESFLSGINEQVQADVEGIDVQLTAFQSRLIDFQAASADILSGVAENFIDGFANIIAGVAQGRIGFGAVGGLLLSTLGDLATQLGKAAIKIGLTMKAIKLSFSNPFAAIAAGVGLLVVGSILKGLAGNFGGGGGGAPRFADGGIVGGTSYYGDKILARVNSGELILNEKQQKNLYGLVAGGGGGNTVVVGGEIKFDGRKMAVALKAVDNYNNRVK